MPGLLPETPALKWLIVVAASKEWQAVAPALSGHDDTPVPPEWTRTHFSDRFDAVLAGVGKANAAGATARALDPDRHIGVISLGIAGALPGASLSICSVIIATRSLMGDEGIITPDGYRPLSSMGFTTTPEGDAIACSPSLIDALAPLRAEAGTIATVSTCSGTDAHAQELARRTGAIAEAMEGAAVGASTRRILGPDAPFIELRVISNTTGDRDAQQWDLPRALETLHRVASAL